MAVRMVDIATLALVLLCSFSSASLDVNLAQLLRGRQRQNIAQKRMYDGNPCPEPEKPFPCKLSPTCIPMAYICDDNFDCEDGYDEDLEVCTAAHRPPVEDITHFLDINKDWILPNVFGGKSVSKVAHGLAVSMTMDDFKKRIGLSSKDMRNLKELIKSVKNNNEEMPEKFGMPPNAWDEVSFFIKKLLKSGFNQEGK